MFQRFNTSIRKGLRILVNVIKLFILVRFRVIWPQTLICLKAIIYEKWTNFLSCRMIVKDCSIKLSQQPINAEIDSQYKYSSWIQRT